MSYQVDRSSYKANALERAFDRALAVFAPNKARRIMKEREGFKEQAAKAFAYSGGQRGNRNRQQATIFPNSSPESSLIQLERIQCMWESRSLSDNFGIADYIYKLYCDYCVPDFSTIRWNTGNKDDDAKLRAKFLIWARGLCDYTGRDTLNQLMRLSKRSQLRDGDIALRCVSDTIEMGQVKRKCLRLQLIEADRIGSPFNVVVSESYIGGLVLDPETKRVLEYDIYKRPPQGSTYLPQAKIPAEEILHIRSLRRADQYRGIALLAPALPAYTDLKETLDNARIGTKIQSSFTMFIQSPTGDASDDELVYPGMEGQGTSDPGTGQTRTYKDFSPGMNYYGNPGEEPIMLKNEQPSGAMQVLVKTLFIEMFCCAGIEYSFAYDGADLTGPGIRLSSAKTQRTFQQDWTFNQEYLFGPVVNRWAQHEFDNGYFDDLSQETRNNRAWTNFTVTQPAHPSVDIGRESSSNLAELDKKIKSRHTIAAEQGIDWDVESDQIKKEDADLSGGRMEVSNSLASSLGDQGAKAIAQLLIAYGTKQISRDSAIGAGMVLYGLDKASAEKLFPNSAERDAKPDAAPTKAGGGESESSMSDAQKTISRVKKVLGR